MSYIYLWKSMKKSRNIESANERTRMREARGSPDDEADSHLFDLLLMSP